MHEGGEENLNFNNNYNFKELEISIVNIFNKRYQCRNSDSNKNVYIKFSSHDSFLK